MTPEQEEQVRRALAAAGGRHPGDDRAGDGAGDGVGDGAGAGEARQDPPLPPDVADRLDGVLAELTAPRRRATPTPLRATTDPTEAGPTDGHDEREVVRFADGVAARRRPRRWPQALVAAAAVSVIGLAGTAVVQGWFTGSSSSDSSSATSGTSRSDDGLAEKQGSADAQGGGSAASGPGVPALSTATLGRDVRRLVAGRGAGVSALRAQPERGEGSASPSGPAPRSAPAPGCVRPVTRAGDRLVAVRLDGRPATLRLHRVRGGTRVAQVYPCDDAGSPVATTRVPPR